MVLPSKNSVKVRDADGLPLGRKQIVVCTIYGSQFIVCGWVYSAPESTLDCPPRVGRVGPKVMHRHLPAKLRNFSERNPAIAAFRLRLDLPLEAPTSHFAALAMYCEETRLGALLHDF